MNATILYARKSYCVGKENALLQLNYLEQGLGFYPYKMIRKWDKLKIILHCIMSYKSCQEFVTYVFPDTMERERELPEQAQFYKLLQSVHTECLL